MRNPRLDLDQKCNTALSIDEGIGLVAGLLKNKTVQNRVVKPIVKKVTQAIGKTKLAKKAGVLARYAGQKLTKTLGEPGADAVKQGAVAAGTAAKKKVEVKIKDAWQKRRASKEERERILNSYLTYSAEGKTRKVKVKTAIKRKDHPAYNQAIAMLKKSVNEAHQQTQLTLVDTILKAVPKGSAELSKALREFSRTDLKTMRKVAQVLHLPQDHLITREDYVAALQRWASKRAA